MLILVTMLILHIESLITQGEHVNAVTEKSLPLYKIIP